MGTLTILSDTAGQYRPTTANKSQTCDTQAQTSPNKIERKGDIEILQSHIGNVNLKRWKCSLLTQQSTFRPHQKTAGTGNNETEHTQKK
jgi:hypothetical protein